MACTSQILLAGSGWLSHLFLWKASCLARLAWGPTPHKQQMGFVALITAKNGGQGPGHVQRSFRAQGKRGSLHTPQEQVLCEISSQVCQNTRGSMHAARLFHREGERGWGTSLWQQLAGAAGSMHVRWPVGCGLRVLVDPRPFTSKFLPVCPAVDFPGTFLGERAEGIRFHGLFRARSSAAGAFLASASLLVSVLFMAPS